MARSYQQHLLVGLQPVHSRRHDHIQQHQVNGLIPDKFDRLFSAGYCPDPVTELLHNGEPYLLLDHNIIYNQYALAVSKVELPVLSKF